MRTLKEKSNPFLKILRESERPFPVLPWVSPDTIFGSV